VRVKKSENRKVKGDCTRTLFLFDTATFPARRGMTYVEVVVSLIILSTAMVASLQAFGIYAMGSRDWGERARALELANQLMAEINALPFEDPMGSVGIGLESGEIAGDRTTFNDIDDYHGWDESPPTNRNGIALQAYAGYRRTVSVTSDNSLAAATGLSLPADAFKKIVVRVFKDEKELARLVTVRSRHDAAD
jgi:hypothetical protein